MENHNEADERLMQLVARGKRDHLATLVRRYASPLLTFIQRMIGDRHRSEELFQEVFLAVWTRRRTYKHPRSFRSWLFAIALNRCRADFRRPVTVSLPPEDIEVAATVGHDPSPAEAAIASETATLVAAAVAQLSPLHRSVVVLRVFNGLSYREIADSVDRAEGTVRSQMFHALASMRKYLEPRL